MQYGPQISPLSAAENKFVAGYRPPPPPRTLPRCAFGQLIAHCLWDKSQQKVERWVASMQSTSATSHQENDIREPGPDVLRSQTVCSMFSSELDNVVPGADKEMQRLDSDGLPSSFRKK